MFANARQAYDLGAKASQSSRDLEANALFKAARMLEDCRSHWDAPDCAARLAEALSYHQHLWTFFQGELTQPGHPMPTELRSWLLSLSVFLDRRVMEVRSNPTADSLEPLIRINREIAQGLSAHSAPADVPTNRAA